MTPMSTEPFPNAASAATVGLDSAARDARGPEGLLVVVIGLIVEGLLPIGSNDGEDQTQH